MNSMKFQVNTLFPPNRSLVKQKTETSPASTQVSTWKANASPGQQGTHIHQLGV